MEESRTVHDDANDIALQQAKAAWAAVHEARRGLNAAWFSVIINSVVVITAISVPYLQHYWEYQEELSNYHSEKEFVLHDSSKDMKIFLDEYNRTASDFDDPNAKSTDREKEAFIKIIQQFRDDWKFNRQKNNNLAMSLTKYSDLVEFVDILDAGLEQADTNMAFAQMKIQYRANITHRDMTNIADAAMHSDNMIENMRDILLSVKINVDRDGKILPGKIKIASCDDPNYAKQCQSFPLRSARDPAEKL